MTTTIYSISNTLKSLRTNGLLFSSLPDEIQQNPIVIKTALAATKILNVERLPELQKVFEQPRFSSCKTQEFLDKIPSLDSNRWRDNGLATLWYAGIQDDPTVALTAFFLDTGVAFNLPVSLKQNLEFMTELIRKNGVLLCQASPELRDNEELVFHAVMQCGTALRFASERLQSLPRICLAAVHNNGLALAYARGEALLQEHIIRTAIDRDGSALQYAPAFQDNENIVRTAVQKTGTAIQWASQRCKGIRQLGLEAVIQDGMALKHLSAELQNDPDIVLSAVKSYAAAIAFASPLCRKNRTIALTALMKTGAVWKYIDPTLRKDAELEKLFLSWACTFGR